MDFETYSIFFVTNISQVELLVLLPGHPEMYQEIIVISMIVLSSACAYMLTKLCVIFGMEEWFEVE